jgi:drug/metabolite transporter (DMT)-like permease
MTRVLSGRAAPLMVLVGGALAIAFAPIFVRLAETGPAAAGFWRLGFALPLLGVTAMLERRGQPEPGGWSPHRLALLAGVFFALDLGFWHYGIVLTSVANATILANLSPVFVAIAAWLLLGERPGWGFAAGLALALAGAWAIAAAKVGGAGTNPPLGDALSIVTSGWYAAYILCVRKVRLSHGASQVMLWSSMVGAPLLLAYAAMVGERLAPATLGGWGACVGLGLVHVFGQGSIAWALGRLPAANASVVLLIQPAFTALLGWLIFHEQMSPLQAAGGLVALLGVLIAQLASARRAAAVGAS